jgi:FPC/CPF motif-containing protein YcgG
MHNEEMFDGLLWQRLQALQMLDAQHYNYDKRVDADPSSAKFSFSIKEEAFYIVGLHPASSRLARQFSYPTLVFNPHNQFEHLKETTKYDMMKNAVRKRDVALSGSVNPMLQDFGETSEVFQYSGRKYDESWQCPLKIMHTN